MDELSFSLALKEIPIEITDAQGEKKKYTLKELSGKQRDAYLSSMSKRMNFVNGQAQGLKDYNGIHTALLSRCLYDEHDELVKDTELQEYPATVLAVLYKKAHELSGLGDGAAAEAKND